MFRQRSWSKTQLAINNSLIFRLIAQSLDVRSPWVYYGKLLDHGCAERDIVHVDTPHWVDYETGLENAMEKKKRISSETTFTRQQIHRRSCFLQADCIEPANSATANINEEITKISETRLNVSQNWMARKKS